MHLESICVFYVYTLLQILILQVLINIPVMYIKLAAVSLHVH